MKKVSFIIISAIAIMSCNTKEKEDKVAVVDSMGVAQKPDSSNMIKDSHYFWTSELDQKEGLVMKKLTPVSSDSLTVDNMISMINKEHPEIKLDFERVTHDSIFVRIKNSKYLTQQMGSTGADAYLAEVTYNLTELSNINFVYIGFKEGDHAAPGIYTRTDFVKVSN
jgi:hypothetical protein